MEHIDKIKILLAFLFALKFIVVYLIGKTYIVECRTVHLLEYVEPKVTVAIRHRFESIEDFKKWRRWREEIKQEMLLDEAKEIISYNKLIKS